MNSEPSKTKSAGPHGSCPCPPAFLPEALDNFEQYLLKPDDDLDPLVRAFVAHYQFETIHPFRDGNGRVGRLLLSLAIAEWCQLSRQWLYMSAYFEKRKQEYMDLLLQVSTHARWDLWIRFCLEGVIEQSIDTENRCEKLLAAHRDFNQRLQGASLRLASIVNGLFENPVVSVTTIKNRFKVTYPTAKSDLQKLQVMGIVEPLEGTALIAYYSPTIYRITFADIP